MAQWRSPLACALRDRAMRATPARLTESALIRLLADAQRVRYPVDGRELRDRSEALVRSLADLGSRARAGNCLAIGNKRLVVVEGTKFAKTLEKRGWTCIEVPYKTLYTLFGSGIHCSTASLWREFD